ncbi:hypothetical protein A2U01_0074212, partial [Trifolium medium]|nr:hypothetical protein [Trifolium medium]
VDFLLAALSCVESRGGFMLVTASSRSKTRGLLEVT